jgi:hypothetical protein
MTLMTIVLLEVAWIRFKIEHRVNSVDVQGNKILTVEHSAHNKSILFAYYYYKGDIFELLKMIYSLCILKLEHRQLTLYLTFLLIPARQLNLQLR